MKISALTDGGAALLTDDWPVVRGGSNFKVGPPTADQINIPANATTGQTERLVTDRFADMVYVTSYSVRPASGDVATALNAMFARTDIGNRFHFPPGVYSIGSVINLRSNLHITADPGAIVLWTGAASATSSTTSPWWILREASVQASPLTFSTKVSIKGLRFEATNKRFVTILAVNVRGLKVIDCEFYNCGGLRVTHELMLNGTYSATNGTGADPAVLAGFSATLLDDLNEDIRFIGNQVDGVTYNAQACRLDFVRRFVITNNICKYAAISWWGGAASHDAGGWGGLKIYLRRVCEGVISNNYISWTNGGIYGNNGASIVISANTVEFIVDTGIDLEGCMHCSVTGNTVKYCGNFCMSTFYVTYGNAFTNNTLIQGPLAADLNTQAGTAAFSPSLGRSFFTQISALSDIPYSQLKITGGSWTWDGAIGFGTCSMISYTEWEITNVTMNNVVFDSTSNVSAISGKFNDNTCNFTNLTSTSVPYSVYLAFGLRKDTYSTIEVRRNTVNVINDVATTIPMLFLTTSFNGLSLHVVEDNIVNSVNAIYPMAHCDARTRTGSIPKNAFKYRNNVVRAGTIKDLSIITTTSGSHVPTVVDSTNYNMELASISVNVTPDTSLYASMVFGSSVLGGTLPAVPIFQATSSMSTTSAALTCTPAYPTVANNDIILLLVGSDNDSVISTPAGWTAVGTQVVVDSGFSAWLFWKRSDGTETGTLTVTRAASTPALSVFMGKMTTWRGCVTTGTPFEGAGEAHGTDIALLGPPVTVSGYSRLVVMLWTYGDDLVSTVPAGWTQVAQTNTGTGNDGTTAIDSITSNASVDRPTREISTSQPYVAFGLALIPA